MTLPEYCKLKQYIVSSVESNERHSEKLSSMKEFFRDSINSVRRFEQINSIGELLKVLEVRDFLSEDNVECLKDIALKLPNSKDVLQIITDYESNYMPKEYGNYYTSTPQSQKKEPGYSFLTSSSFGSLRKRQMIFDTIVEQIGDFWRVLGRNLKILERDIDDIDLQNETLPVKVTKLMEKYDHYINANKIAESQRWFFILCDALERTQRKDLVRSIQDIMAMNI